MIAEDYFSGSEADVPERTTTAGRHNRNLSSIVSTIRDDGPSVVDELRPVQDAENTATPVADNPEPALQRRRVRALPGMAVMLRVSAMLSGLALLCSVALLASGKYPAIDERGLYLAELPAGLVTEMTDATAGIQVTFTQWIGRVGELIGGLASTESEGALIVSPDMDAVAARQAQIIARLDALAATVTALQVRFDRQQAEQVAGSVTQQAAQALQLEALKAQLVELQQQTAASPATPAQPAGQSRGTLADTPTPATGDWVVNVASSSREGPIKALQHKLRQQDIRTELQRTDVQGKPRYRLRVTGFSSGGEARRYAARLEQQADLQGAWVSKR